MLFQICLIILLPRYLSDDVNFICFHLRTGIPIPIASNTQFWTEPVYINARWLQELYFFYYSM